MFPSLQLHMSDYRILVIPPLEYLEGGAEKRGKISLFYLTKVLIQLFKSNVCWVRGSMILIKIRFLALQNYISILPPIVIESWLYFLFLHFLAWFKDILEHSRSIEVTVLKEAQSAAKRHRAEPFKVTVVLEFWFRAYINISNLTGVA